MSLRVRSVVPGFLRLALSVARAVFRGWACPLNLLSWRLPAMIAANLVLVFATQNVFAQAPSLTSMPGTRYGGNGAGAINGKLYITGGWTQSPPLPNSNLREYEPGTNQIQLGGHRRT